MKGISLVTFTSCLTLTLETSGTYRLNSHHRIGREQDFQLSNQPGFRLVQTTMENDIFSKCFVMPISSYILA